MVYNKELVSFKFKAQPGSQGGVVDLSMNIDYQNNKTLWTNCAAVVSGIDEMLPPATILSFQYNSCSVG